MSFPHIENASLLLVDIRSIDNDIPYIRRSQRSWIDLVTISAVKQWLTCLKKIIKARRRPDTDTNPSLDQPQSFRIKMQTVRTHLVWVTKSTASLSLMCFAKSFAIPSCLSGEDAFRYLFIVLALQALLHWTDNPPTHIRSSQASAGNEELWSANISAQALIWLKGNKCRMKNLAIIKLIRSFGSSRYIDYKESMVRCAWA